MPEAAKTGPRPLELTELLTLLLEVSERISSTLDLDELMVRIAEVVKRAVDYEVFALFLRSVRQSRTLQLLNEISRDLSSVLVLNELLRKIGTLTKHLIDYHRFSILLAEERTQAFNTVISIKRDESMPDRYTVPFGQGIVGAAAKAQQTIVVPDVTKDPRYIVVNPETGSEMAVPLIYRDR